ncbi:hypothetical protein [Nitrosomonas sp. Nm166]|uniref:hypothetical protein n=1 Tax=Nitrosomonas sp. Nm166 TaxID=1881054 RepID=UPI0015A707B0|nr:hypothetical protein [Nitrosomonas sp. Nm166]
MQDAISWWLGQSRLVVYYKGTYANVVFLDPDPSRLARHGQVELAGRKPKRNGHS